jgi:hypothetical protein
MVRGIEWEARNRARWLVEKYNSISPVDFARGQARKRKEIAGKREERKIDFSLFPLPWVR